jgi:hypothetical protein
MIDLVELAHAVGGVLVTASGSGSGHVVEVRMLDQHHVNLKTDSLKLPIVFRGNMQEIREWAKENDYTEVHDKSDVFGGHFRDDHGNSYLMT